MNNNSFENIFESIPHPFYVIDANDYRIKMANSATAFFGDISKNTTCYELTHKRSEPCRGKGHSCPLRLVKRTKRPVTTEHIHYDSSGNRRYIELHGYPVFDSHENVIQMIVYALDITERKHIEKTLQRTRDELEAKVDERTLELTRVNKSLRLEITEHKKAEEKLSQYHRKLRSLASELTLSEERQRKQIATDLHDVVIQTLAMSKIRLSEARKSLSGGKNRKQIDEIRQLIEQAIHQARTLTFELSPPVLHELGFIPAVEWLTEQFQEQHGLQVSFEHNGRLDALNHDIQIVLYRAMRELLINVVKHANANAVAISLERAGGNMLIHISDNGRGFEASELESNGEANGFGLFSIRERLDYLGGCLEIESTPGCGTRATLVAPLSNKMTKRKGVVSK